MPKIIIPYSILALAYIFLASSFHPVIAALLKITPLLLLLAWVARAGGDFRKYLLPALGFGLAGDIAMAFQQLIPGLGLFLVGHIFYMLIWCRQWDFSRRWLQLPLLLVAALAASQLLVHAGALWPEVALYIAVIILMAAMATVSAVVNIAGLIGVYSFLLSDFVIGWNQFIEPLAWASPVIMFTYYLAQLLMVITIIQYQQR